MIPQNLLFVGELFAIDRFTTSSIELGEVSALNHKIWNWEYAAKKY